MNKAIGFLAAVTIIMVYSSNSFAESVEQPIIDKPPVDVKNKDTEGLINGFSTSPFDLNQAETDNLFIQSQTHCCIYRDSTVESSTNIEQYLSIMLPTLLKSDSLDFDLLEIL